MEKIPSLFERDFTTGARSAPVTGQIQPGTEWVLTDDGVIARRKWNGTAVLCTHRDGQAAFYVRRSVPFGPNAPAGFILAEVDDATGRMFGWEPAEQSGYAAPVAEAVHRTFTLRTVWPHPLPATGTYELIGPKVHGNPERQYGHTLERHDTARELEPTIWLPTPGEEPLEGLANIVQTVHGAWGWEGLVFYHPDGQRAKIKARDAREYLNLVDARRATASL